MEPLERAAESIDHLQAIVRRLDEEAAGVNSPASGLEISKKSGPNGVPEEFVSTASEAIQALLDALRTVDGSVHGTMTGPPPKGWRNLRTALSHKRAEYAATHPTFVDAFDILDRHVSEDNASIGGLPFLVERLDHKIMPTGAGMAFRSAGNPNPKGISFSFIPEIDHEIDEPMLELLGKVSIFPEECVAFLRRARDVVSEIMEH